MGINIYRCEEHALSEEVHVDIDEHCLADQDVSGNANGRIIGCLVISLIEQDGLIIVIDLI